MRLGRVKRPHILLDEPACSRRRQRWLQRRRDTGSAKANPSGGSTSPLEEHAEWLLAVVAEQPDLTLDEIVAAMRKRRIPGSRTAGAT
jgi:hypothetical protein